MNVPSITALILATGRGTAGQMNHIKAPTNGQICRSGLYTSSLLKRRRKHLSIAIVGIHALALSRSYTGASLRGK